MTSIYKKIVTAVQNGSLVEPFSIRDFTRACKGIANNTYNTFLSKHRKGNPGKYSEMFIRVSRGIYRLKKPLLNNRLNR